MTGRVIGREGIKTSSLKTSAAEGSVPSPTCAPGGPQGEGSGGFGSLSAVRSNRRRRVAQDGWTGYGKIVQDGTRDMARKGKMVHEFWGRRAGDREPGEVGGRAEDVEGEVRARVEDVCGLPIHDLRTEPSRQWQI